MIRILIGDCVQRMKELPDNSVDSVVCDPPYHLTSIVKRFGAENAAPAKVGKTGAYARASKGFMGQTWDGGDVAFQPETWAEVLRVLKPGGHLVAFSGTRTYHRMAVAIEDAGFEVRDMIAWHYGSGFPKSHDISKAMDKVAPRLHKFDAFAAHYGERRNATAMSHNAICAVGAFHGEHNHGGASSNWEKGYGVPTLAQWTILQPLLGLSLEWVPLIEREEAEREVVASRNYKIGPASTWGQNSVGGRFRPGEHEFDITAPATDAAREWEGWGTALKPATEPICLARKPLSEKSIAANVLKHGCGALNIDACRIETADNLNGGTYSGNSRGQKADSNWQGEDRADGKGSGFRRGVGEFVQPEGRWPANLCHDGSDEVVAGFPSEAGGRDKREGGNGTRPSGFANIGADTGCTEPNGRLYGDEGSAARFFYCAKATTEERGEGNNHPTVKPVALMRWLVRLVTPKGGTVLDPFMGSGSTGLACDAEQFDFIGCELSPEYAAIAERRIRDAAGMFAQIETDKFEAAA